ncbi:DUF6087 family protein [Streptomyces sp. NEAU-Y11]|uniref:DUF6087 family protein n=1 Tax=Streptomyces cucumeris TaxID=2962890 RepID=UPI0020C87C63|nr:DUF6087 family protein [Streptomyces sp. NEAU-Y11]MCP9209233.1 DUF6087 family protein [Streptomyces sp. NEAU-Y11]
MNPEPADSADPADEPLDAWAARREARRAAHREMVGHRRVVALGDGARATHVAPHEPRLLLEWDGTAWVTVGVAENADRAREFLGHLPPPTDASVAGDRQPRLGKGTGRHRRT